MLTATLFTSKILTLFSHSLWNGSEKKIIALSLPCENSIYHHNKNSNVYTFKDGYCTGKNSDFPVISLLNSHTAIPLTLDHMCVQGAGGTGGEGAATYHEAIL